FHSPRGSSATRSRLAAAPLARYDRDRYGRCRWGAAPRRASRVRPDWPRPGVWRRSARAPVACQPPRTRRWRKRSSARRRRSAYRPPQCFKCVSPRILRLRRVGCSEALLRCSCLDRPELTRRGSKGCASRSGAILVPAFLRTGAPRPDSNPCLVTAAFSPLGSTTSAPADSNGATGLKHVRDAALKPGGTPDVARPRRALDGPRDLSEEGCRTPYTRSRSRGSKPLAVRLQPRYRPVSSDAYAERAATSHPVSAGHRGSAASARQGQ